MDIGKHTKRETAGVSETYAQQAREIVAKYFEGVTRNETLIEGVQQEAVEALSNPRLMAAFESRLATRGLHEETITPLVYDIKTLAKQAAIGANAGKNGGR